MQLALPFPSSPNRCGIFPIPAAVTRRSATWTFYRTPGNVPHSPPPPPPPPAADAAASTVADEDEDEWEDSHTEISMADASDSQTSLSAKEVSTPLPPPQASSNSPSKQTKDSALQEKKHALVERGRQLTKSKQRAKQTSLDFEARA